MGNQIGAVRQYELFSLDEFIIDAGECGVQPLWETWCLSHVQSMHTHTLSLSLTHTHTQTHWQSHTLTSYTPACHHSSALTSLFSTLYVWLYAGTRLSEVYQAGVSVVKAERPELEAKMTKSFGFAMGIEFREGSLLIGPKTNAPAKKGRRLWCASLHAAFLYLTQLTRPFLKKPLNSYHNKAIVWDERHRYERS